MNAGFNTTHLVTFHINPVLAGYPKAQIAPLQERALEAMRGLPGVQAVAATNDPELARRQHGRQRDGCGLHAADQ